MTGGEDYDMNEIIGESHVVDECQYCGSEDTVRAAHHTMCESCHKAFLSGKEKGREIEERLDGVRGRREIEEKLEELRQRGSTMSPRQNEKRIGKGLALEWVLGEVGDL